MYIYERKREVIEWDVENTDLVKKKKIKREN